MTGMDEAREQVAIKFGVNNYTLTKDHVFMTSGGSMAIWAAANLLAN
jgi:hypothetical protein